MLGAQGKQPQASQGAASAQLANSQVGTGSKPQDPAEHGSEYLIAQASHIHERVQWYLERHERIEILGLGGSGAIWAFILTQASSDAVPYLKWLPALMSLVLGLKSYLLTKSLSEAFNHLSELEDHFALPAQKGWVHYFTQRSAKYKRRWRSSFWIGLVIVNTAAALFVPFADILSPANPAPIESTPHAQLTDRLPSQPSSEISRND
jgi:hypothetical protein